MIGILGDSIMLCNDFVQYCVHFIIYMENSFWTFEINEKRSKSWYVYHKYWTIYELSYKRSKFGPWKSLMIRSKFSPVYIIYYTYIGPYKIIMVKKRLNLDLWKQSLNNQGLKIEISSWNSIHYVWKGSI